MSQARLGIDRCLCLAWLLILPAVPARAEIGASLTLATEDRFRGYSVSGGYPATTLSLSYDDAAGPYAGGSMMVAGNPSEGIQRSRLELSGGYALRLKDGPTLDTGIIHSEYGGYRIRGAQAVLSEIYIGVLGKNVSAHIHYSPHYFERHVSTFYAEVNGSAPLAPRLHIAGHYGLLIPVVDRQDQGRRALPDWRIGIGADRGKVSFELALTRGSHRNSVYGATERDQAALLASVTTAF